jgi:hypothetical protein
MLRCEKDGPFAIRGKGGAMGEKLVKYYALAEQNGGLSLKLRLAMLTGIQSTKAQETPDSPENLTKFYEAMKKIIGPAAPRL